MANGSPYHRLYDTSRWKQRRARQLRREPLCRMCKQIGNVTPATVADHVKPHRGDQRLFFEGELQSLCKPCHDGHKQAQDNGSGLAGCDGDGLPVDPGHHWNG